MSDQRVFLEAGRFILSRPGFHASPSMPNDEKILDSEWGYAGTVIASGIDEDPAPMAAGNIPYETQGSQPPWTIPFPDPGYVPVVLLQHQFTEDLGSFGTHECRSIRTNHTFGTNGDLVWFTVRFSVHRGFIRGDRYSTNNPAWPSRVGRFTSKLVWTVFGFGG